MSDDIVARLADEIERLQERCTEQAHWIDAAVSKCATQQCSRRAAQLLELQAEIERLRAALERAHDVWETEAAGMRDEIERLQAELGAAEAFHRVAVAERNHERVITARLRADLDRFAADNQAAVTAYATEITEAKAEIERLRADRDHWREARRNAIEAGDELLREIERLRSDRREMLAQLRFIRTHLYAATVQRSPADDRIIADHIEQAYLRANEVIAEMEKCDE